MSETTIQKKNKNLYTDKEDVIIQNTLNENKDLKKGKIEKIIEALEKEGIKRSKYSIMYRIRKLSK